MKKYFLVVLFVGFFGMSFAQEANTSGNIVQNVVTPGETKIITQDLGSDNMTDLQNIQSRFCNDDKLTKDLNLIMRPGERKEICIAFGNHSPKPINVLFGFSEGSFTTGGGPICQADISIKNQFAKRIINNTITGITVPASGTSIQKFIYLVPRTASGNIFGCFGYQINKEESIKKGNMFLIVPRKVGYIYINILGSVYNFGRRDNMKDIYANNKAMILKVLIGILAIWLIVSIVQTNNKNKNKNKNGQANKKKEAKENTPTHHKKK